MRMVCISRNNDIGVGLRFAGIQTFIIDEAENIVIKLKDLIKDEDVGIINVTEDVYNLCHEEIDKITQKKDFPLIIKIPNTK